MWQADVESQAIKVRCVVCKAETLRNLNTQRAHRIGQTRPITGVVSFTLFKINHPKLILFAVKTLAIRKTAEEKMVSRRVALKNCQEKLPKLIEEAGMRHYIEVRLCYSIVRYSYVNSMQLEPEVHHPYPYINTNRRLPTLRTPSGS